MSALFDKLNLKDQRPVVVVDAPPEFAAALATLGERPFVTALPRSGPLEWVLAFVTRRARLDALAARIVERAGDDPVLWFAYPKRSSRRLRCEFHRDTGWDVLEAAGFETVRAVAIDDDWSALRFRRSVHVRRA